MNSYCAIFDLDETIIKFKSMFGVLEQYFINQSDSEEIGKVKFKEFEAKLIKFSVTCEYRDELNIFYYKLLFGVFAKEIQAAAMIWFTKNKNTIFNDRVIKEINYHRDHGADIVLVTGSFLDCIKPITTHLGIRHIICSQPEKVSGFYTGKILCEPVIGNGKANLLIKYLKANDLTLSGSYAYGDHETDIPFLSLAENPIVVGDNPVLLEYAKDKTWTVLELR